MVKFGVQKGISGNIWVGNVNAKSNEFTKKEDKTLQVVVAVMELIQENDSKGMATVITDGKKRYILSVEEKDVNMTAMAIITEDGFGFHEKTESEAVFEACQWILGQRGN